MNTQLHIVFGATNGYQASGNPLFGRRTRIAGEYKFCTRQEAIDWLMEFAADESDNNMMNDDGTAVMNGTREIMNNKNTAYHYDGYTWEVIGVDEISEEDAQLAISMGRVPADWIYEARPDLKPEEVDEEDTTA